MLKVTYSIKDQVEVHLLAILQRDLSGLDPKGPSKTKQFLRQNLVHKPKKSKLLFSNVHTLHFLVTMDGGNLEKKEKRKVGILRQLKLLSFQ